MRLARIKALPVVFTAAAIISQADALNVGMFGTDAHPASAPAIQYVAAQKAADAQDRCLAISYILGRIVSGQHIEEDWTWQNAPAVVNKENDRLWDEQEAAPGHTQDSEMWLVEENTKCITNTTRKGI